MIYVSLGKLKKSRIRLGSESMYFGELTQEEFQQYMATAKKNSFLQSVEMARLKQAEGYDCYFVGIKDDKQEEVLFASLLTAQKLKIGQFFEIDGLSLEALAERHAFFMKELQAFVKKKQGMYISILPNDDYGVYQENGQLIGTKQQQLYTLMEEVGFTYPKNEGAINQNGSPKWVYTKDLTQLATETDLWDSYEKKARYSIQKAQSFGIKVRGLAYEELDLFKAVTLQTSQRRGFTDKSLDYYQKVFKSYGEQAQFLVAELNLKDYLDSLEQRKSQLVEQRQVLDELLAAQPNSRKRNNQKKEVVSEIATYEKRIAEATDWRQKESKETIILACGLFLSSPQEMVYLFSGTYEEYKHLYGPFLIQDYALKQAVTKKIPLYNFYGIEGIFDGSDGVLNFKKNFSGQVNEKPGMFLAVTQPFKWGLYQKLKTIQGRFAK